MNTSIEREAAPDNNQPTLNDLVLPLYNVKGWMRLIGVMLIIGGIMQCLTCVGVIIGWLPIWMGVTMMGAATAIQSAHDLQDTRQIVMAQRKLALYLKITGVLLLAWLLLSAVMMFMMLILPRFIQPLLERLPDFQKYLV